MPAPLRVAGLCSLATVRGLSSVLTGLGAMMLLGCPRFRPCDEKPLMDYAQRRSKTAVAERSALASRALLESCPHQLRRFQVDLLLAQSVEAADQRAMSLARIDNASRIAFWSSVCPKVFRERKTLSPSLYERHIAQWRNCAIEPLSPFPADDLREGNWSPALWEIRVELERGGLDPDASRHLVRDVVTEQHPSRESWALSSSRRPVPPLFGGDAFLDLDARTIAQTFEVHVEAHERLEVRVRRDDPWFRAALIPIEPLDESPAVDAQVRVGKGPDLDRIVASGRSHDPKRPLRLHVDADATWQDVVNAIDGALATCGGWQPYLEANPTQLGEHCPFTGVQLIVEHPRWDRLRMVVGPFETFFDRTPKPHPKLRRRVEAARESVEACMREDNAYRRNERHDIYIGFGRTEAGELGSFSMVLGGDDSRQRFFVTRCIDAALGLPRTSPATKGARMFAGVVVDVELPPG